MEVSRFFFTLKIFLLIIFSLGLIASEIGTATTTGKFFLIMHTLPQSVTSGIPTIHVT